MPPCPARWLVCLEATPEPSSPQAAGSASCTPTSADSPPGSSEGRACLLSHTSPAGEGGATDRHTHPPQPATLPSGDQGRAGLAAPPSPGPPTEEGTLSTCGPWAPWGLGLTPSRCLWSSCPSGSEGRGLESSATSRREEGVSGRGRYRRRECQRQPRARGQRRGRAQPRAGLAGPSLSMRSPPQTRTASDAVRHTADVRGWHLARCPAGCPRPRTECLAGVQLLCFGSSPLLEADDDVRSVESRPRAPMWDTWMEFQASGFSPPGLVAGECTSRRRRHPLCLAFQ